MNANERRRTHMHERRCKGTDADVRMGTDADVWARTQTYMHERTRMGTDADVHARTRTDADVLWDLSEMDAHARERTHTGDRRTYMYIRARKKHAVRGGRARKKHAVRGGLNSN